MSFSEQIMSANKYPSIFFALNGDYCLYIPNRRSTTRLSLSVVVKIKLTIRCVTHLRLSGKLASIHELILLISRGHVSITTFSSSFCFQLIKTFFHCLHIHGVGSGPPHQYFENKNHESRYSTVLD